MIREELRGHRHVLSYLVLDNWVHINEINGALLQCIQVNPLGVTKPGSEGFMEMILNISGISKITVVVHNKGQLYNPNSYGLFGSDSGIVNIVPNMRKGQKHRFSLMRTHLVSIDQPGDRCGYNIGNQTATTCIMNFLRDNIRCHVPLQHMEAGAWPACNKEAQFTKLMKLGYLLDHSVFTESRMEEVTKCLSPCEKAGFSQNTFDLIGLKLLFWHYLQDKWQLETLDKIAAGKKNELILSFEIPDGLYYVKQQYYLHDFNSFIADVGGYLGLLLGHSALGLFSMLMEQWCIKRKGSIHHC